MERNIILKASQPSPRVKKKGKNLERLKMMYIDLHFNYYYFQLGIVDIGFFWANSFSNIPTIFLK